MLKEISASKLVWNALIHASQIMIQLNLTRTQKDGETSVDSQLVYHLKNHAWIPNTSGEFSTPRAMTHEALRADFPFNNGNGLLIKSS